MSSTETKPKKIGRTVLAKYFHDNSYEPIPPHVFYREMFPQGELAPYHEDGSYDPNEWKYNGTLAEDIEELRSEKAMLLQSLDCADDAAMGDVKKDIADMEAVLKKLDEQEGKYSAELESALQQYRELQAQAAEFDADELTDVRVQLRPSMDRSTVSRVQTTYGKQYSPFTMAEAKRDVSNMLGEDDELRSARDWLRNPQQEQTAPRKKEKDRDR